MALLWMDGFDVYAASADLAANYSTGGFTVTTNGSIWGTGIVSEDGISSRFIARLGSFPLEVWTSFRIYSDNPANNDLGLIQFFSPASVETTISLNTATGVLKAWRGRVLDTILGTATMARWTNTTWHWLDIRYKYSGSVGEIEVWLDDVQVMNLTGLNTALNASQTSLAAISLGSGMSPSTNTISGKYDDWIINDTTGTVNAGRMGDTRIETLVPTSDATPNDGTPSTGTSHFGVVDEAQYNTSDYLTIPNTSGDKEVFGFSDLSGTPSTIKGVCVRLASEKTDAGAYSLQPLIISNSVESDGTSKSLLATWSFQQAMFETDPNTSAAWTYTAVNAATAGFKVP